MMASDCVTLQFSALGHFDAGSPMECYGAFTATAWHSIAFQKCSLHYGIGTYNALHIALYSLLGIAE